MSAGEVTLMAMGESTVLGVILFSAKLHSQIGCTSHERARQLTW